MPCHLRPDFFPKPGNQQLDLGLNFPEFMKKILNTSHGTVNVTNKQHLFSRIIKIEGRFKLGVIKGAFFVLGNELSPHAVLNVGF